MLRMNYVVNWKRFTALFICICITFAVFSIFTGFPVYAIEVPELKITPGLDFAPTPTLSPTPVPSSTSLQEPMRLPAQTPIQAFMEAVQEPVQVLMETPISLQTEPQTTPYLDINPVAWYYNDVVFVYANGFMQGTSATMFNPDAPMTWGMLVHVMFNIANRTSPVPVFNPFSGTADGSFSSEAMPWANQFVTRQDLAVILAHYIGIAGNTLPENSTYSAFSDERQIAGYAAEAIKELYMAGVVGGKPNNIYDPLGNATRAEFASMIRRLIEGL
jgi:hypothetical protein